MQMLSKKLYFSISGKHLFNWFYLNGFFWNKRIFLNGENKADESNEYLKRLVKIVRIFTKFVINSNKCTIWMVIVKVIRSFYPMFVLSGFFNVYWYLIKIWYTNVGMPLSKHWHVFEHEALKSFRTFNFANSIFPVSILTIFAKQDDILWNN